MAKFSAKLSEWRLSHALNQEQAAHILGMSKRMYQYYEWGQRNIAPNKQRYLEKLMEEFQGNAPVIVKDRTTYLYTADRIIQLRKQHALTQKQFAESLGLTQGAIAHIENGDPISQETLMKISKRYNVTVTDLLPPVQEAKQPEQVESIEALKKEIQMLREMLKMKDELIEVLKKQIQ